MFSQDSKRRLTKATNQMLRKTVLPAIVIALGLLLLVVSGTQAIATMASVATSEPASLAHKVLPALEGPASFTEKQWFGKQLFFNTNLSMPAGQVCAACHAPQVGWTRPDTMINQGGMTGQASYGPISEPVGAE